MQQLAYCFGSVAKTVGQSRRTGWVRRRSTADNRRIQVAEPACNGKRVQLRCRFCQRPSVGLVGGSRPWWLGFLGGPFISQPPKISGRDKKEDTQQEPGERSPAHILFQSVRMWKFVGK